MINLPDGIQRTDRKPLIGDYWASDKSSLNSAYAHHGHLKFARADETLWIKLTSGWKQINLDGAETRPSVSTFQIGSVTEGAVAAVRNVGTAQAVRLEFVLPRASTPDASTVSIDSVVMGDVDSMPFVQNIGTASNARYILTIPKIRGERGKPFGIDASGLAAGLSTYSNQTEGFTYLVAEPTHPLNGHVFIRTASGWSDPLPFLGTKGDPGEKGADGAKGADGLAGSKGDSIWVAYATSVTGTGASNSSTGMSFVAFQQAASQPALSSFTGWTRIGGEAADPVVGPAGKSAYQSYFETTSDNPKLNEAQWVASLIGTDGVIGSNGRSAFESYLALTSDNPKKTELQWIASLKGAAGTDGKSAYQSYLDTTSESPRKNEPEWVASLKGTNGTIGVDGRSAYQLAVSEGFVGSQTQWVASLKGATGIQGPAGPVNLDTATPTLAGASDLFTYSSKLLRTSLGDPMTLVTSSKVLTGAINEVSGKVQLYKPGIGVAFGAVDAQGVKSINRALTQDPRSPITIPSGGSYAMPEMNMQTPLLIMSTPASGTGTQMSSPTSWLNVQAFASGEIEINSQNTGDKLVGLFSTSYASIAVSQTDAAAQTFSDVRVLQTGYYFIPGKINLVKWVWKHLPVGSTAPYNSYTLEVSIIPLD